MYACVELSVSDNDFFERRAIRWTSREHAKTNPGEVIGRVEAKGISGLSRRETLENSPVAQEIPR
ncbi:hypothetical protein [Streptosporangium sp. OZ121]|uniref:hypothetical protein n=1 Tax=Streptosporangium sp. OZ121 TaxID=3444183 RepID=UPI003F7A069C